MSVTVECPAAKYGKSSEFGVILDFIQTMISNDTLRHTFNIPHLVMVGRQNMAKTTLINRLIGRYLLPMRRNETANTLQARTTHPIILNLRNGDRTQVEVKCENIPKIGGKVENPTDAQVETFLTQMAERLPKEPGTPISKMPVSVTLEGPTLTTLTLVDLPGAHFANDNPRMNLVTQGLVLDYIKKNTKSIIVIVSEVGDPTGDSAINLVMQQAVDFRKRTICVLTKPDRLRDSDDMGKKVALNQSSFTLEENRFIVLRGKDGTDKIEKDWDAETTRVKEKEWFSRHPVYGDMQHLCGIDRLMDTMISLLAEKMVTEVPVLVREMKKKKTEVETELRVLTDSEVPESKEGKGALVMKLKQNLIKQLETLLFNNTLDTEGGEDVRQLFHEFQENILKVDPLVDRDDKEIRNKQKKLEGVTAPLGDSSENNQLLQKLLYEKYTARSKGLPQAREIKSPVGQLVPISEKLVDDVEKKLQEIVQGAINSTLYKFPTLKQAVETKVVNRIFDRKRDETLGFLHQFHEMQKRSIDVIFAPVPLPQDLASWEAAKLSRPAPTFHSGSPKTEFIAHPSMTSKMMSHMKHLSRKLYPDPLVTEIQNYTGLVHYKEEEELKRIKLNVVRCFNVLKMNVCDTVPRCILHFFVAQLVEDLSDALEKENLGEFLVERKDIQMRRILCQAQYTALKEALPRTDGVLNTLLHLRKGEAAGKKH